jgi:hypothetical protein
LSIASLYRPSTVQIWLTRGENGENVGAEPHTGGVGDMKDKDMTTKQKPARRGVNERTVPPALTLSN